MNKVKNRFVLYAELVVFVLLTVLMIVINSINFTMAAEDADNITKAIKNQNGFFEKGIPEREHGIGGFAQSDRLGPMGPDSPEMDKSLRYFTIAFVEDGNSSTVSYKLSAVSEEEAHKWAASLLNAGKTGWTNGTYRYRVYKKDGTRYVTVIDQGRELLSCYRILNISIVGVLVVMVLSFLILNFAGKYVFRPLEEADRKQKQFIKSVENDFRMPLTVINANTELMEKESGPSEETGAINRQVRSMSKLVKNLSAFAIFEEKEMTRTKLSLSDMLHDSIENKREEFKKAGIELTAEADHDIMIEADEETVRRALYEIVDNSLKYSEGKADFSLKKQGERITMTVKNPTSLPNGSSDQVFDRFTRLSNASDKEGAGLGLSYVRETVRMLGGRVSAKVVSGEFILRITL